MIPQTRHRYQNDNIAGLEVKGDNKVDDTTKLDIIIKLITLQEGVILTRSQRRQIHNGRAPGNFSGENLSLRWSWKKGLFYNLTVRKSITISAGMQARNHSSYYVQVSSNGMALRSMTQGWYVVHTTGLFYITHFGGCNGHDSYDLNLKLRWQWLDL